jgi:hypothetical protein
LAGRTPYLGGKSPLAVISTGSTIRSQAGARGRNGRSTLRSQDRIRGGEVAQVRVPRKGVTQAELTNVLSRRLGGGYEVESNGDGQVIVRRGTLSAAVIKIKDVPGATVFRVRGGGLPVVRIGTARRVADALRRSPEFRSV